MRGKAVLLLAAILVAGGSSAQANAAPKKLSKATFEVRGSIGQAYVLEADPGSSLKLVNPKGKVIRRGKADRLGSKIFRYLKPDKGYSVRQVKGRQTFASSKFRVLKAGANPKPSFFDRKVINEGLNYVTMRDGVELAMTVRLPPERPWQTDPSLR